MSQGYKLINTDYGETNDGENHGLQDGNVVRAGVTFYLAIP